MRREFSCALSQGPVLWLRGLWMSSHMINLRGCADLSDRTPLAGVAAAAYTACTMPRAHVRLLRKK